MCWPFSWRKGKNGSKIARFQIWWLTVTFLNCTVTWIWGWGLGFFFFFWQIEFEIADKFWPISCCSWGTGSWRDWWDLKERIAGDSHSEGHWVSLKPREQSFVCLFLLDRVVCVVLLSLRQGWPWSGRSTCVCTPNAGTTGFKRFLFVLTPFVHP